MGLSSFQKYMDRKEKKGPIWLWLITPWHPPWRAKTHKNIEVDSREARGVYNMVNLSRRVFPTLELHNRFRLNLTGKILIFIAISYTPARWNIYRQWKFDPIYLWHTFPIPIKGEDYVPPIDLSQLDLKMFRRAWLYKK